MKTEDISLIVIYLITMLCMVTYGILGIIEKYKVYKTSGRNYKPDYTGEIINILGGLTPGCIIIGGFIIIIGFMALIIEGPNWILNKILK